MNLNVKLVVADGVIDEEASLEAFASALAHFKAERETEETHIAQAVAAQFDTYPGAAQNMPALVNGALTFLNVTPSTYSVLQEKVAEYIRANADHPAVKSKDGKTILTPAEAKRTRAFSIAKGVGGGVRRWSDVPE